MKPHARTRRHSVPERHPRLGLRRGMMIALLLAVVIIIPAFVWFRQDAQDSRVIQISGQGTIRAVPDEYVFRTKYEFRGTDEQATYDIADKKHQELFARLQDMGVRPQNIKANMQRTERPLRDGISDEITYALTLTVTAGDQYQGKVQDYLAATQPASQISQYLQFGEQKRKGIEEQATDKAIKDARAKAERVAQKLGASVGGVKKVSEGFSFGHPTSWDTLDASTQYHAVLHPGENDVTYTIMVTFFLR